MKLVIVVFALAGCVLPVPAGAPQPADTAHRGRLRVGGSLEIEPPDLALGNAKNDELSQSKFPNLTLNAGVGVAEHVDVELYVDMPLYYGMPVPSLLTLGGRLQLVDARDNGSFDLAIAGRAGGGAVDQELEALAPSGVSATATGATVFGAGSIVGEIGGASPIHLRAAGQALIAHVWGKTDADSAALFDTRFDTALLSATVAVPLRFGSVEIAPYVTTARLTDSPVGGRSYVSGGISVLLHPARAIWQ